jgi:predicted fused transcriptional regulator/phosphomethylpyrimidine kinase
MDKSSNPKETILEQLEAMADFIHDNEEYKDKIPEMRLNMSKRVHDELTKEVGHAVDVVGGVRIEVIEEEGRL